MPVTEITLKPSEAKLAIRACLDARQPVFLWGQPGIAKSSIVNQVITDLSRIMVDVRASTLSDVDAHGMPFPDGDVMRWKRPYFISGDPLSTEVIFFDELNRGQTSTLNSLFQIILDRQIGEHKLPPGVDMIAAGNRETDGGGINRMPAALANRFVHINVEPDLKDWVAWAIGAGIDPMNIGFMNFRPALLHQFDPKAHAFPTPRSWEFVDRITKQHNPANIELALVAGAVGHGAAIEHAGFARMFRSLQGMSYAAILSDPNGAPVSSDIQTLYAVSSLLSQNAAPDNFDRIIQYLNRLPAEFARFAVKTATGRDPRLESTSAFTQWFLANGAL